MLMMMGSADALPTAPKEKTKFLEDMSESELASVLDVPAGLKNLGNTCYLNATLQCLKSVPELRQALKDFQGNGLNMADGGEAITGAPALALPHTLPRSCFQAPSEICTVTWRRSRR